MESGYVPALEVYTGKKRDNVEQGLGSKVVLSPTEELTNTYRHNFCSAGLLIDLFISLCAFSTSVYICTTST